MEHSTGPSYGEAYFDLAPQLPCHVLFLDPSNASLLSVSKDNPDQYVRIGIAKSIRIDRQKYDEPMLRRDRPGFQSVPYGSITKADKVSEITIINIS